MAQVRGRRQAGPHHRRQHLFRYYLESLAGDPAHPSDSSAMAGFQSLKFMTADVVFDGGFQGVSAGTGSGVLDGNGITWTSGTGSPSNRHVLPQHRLPVPASARRRDMVPLNPIASQSIRMRWSS
jgi:hypothetical protein